MQGGWDTDCNGAECKVGTSCELDCAFSGKSCRNVRCNHDASCDFACNTRNLRRK